MQNKNNTEVVYKKKIIIKIISIFKDIGKKIQFLIKKKNKKSLFNVFFTNRSVSK